MLAVLALLAEVVNTQQQNGTSVMPQLSGNDSKLYRLIEANGTSGWNVTTDGAENGEPPWLTPVVAVLCALVFFGVNVLMFFVDDPGKKEFYRDRTADRPEAPDESYVAVPIEEPSNPASAVGQNMLSKDNAQSVAFNTRTEVVSIDQLEEWQGIGAQEEKGPIEQQ
ncbi:hypothetical protein [Endozoicomonas atrinae]|uniref:hypothetical protein n=1 Tax=Endozoicomonas atrinae TaxID=1333660 RepID=UPI003B007FB8